jgi:hypothetical protein
MHIINGGGVVVVGAYEMSIYSNKPKLLDGLILI